jgi:putative NIF3 family GTP cyclohydrolase 1 type 2
MSHKITDKDLRMQRREFLSSSLTIGSAALLSSNPGVYLTTPFATATRSYTVQDVINIIYKEIPGAPFKPTVDTIKIGDAKNQVTGTVTTMFPTVAVIEETARLGANFIIAHEPSYYNHEDDLNWVQHNSVLEKKRQLLDKSQITIWRFHDHWHAYKPDGIRYGVLKSTGWLPYSDAGKAVLEIPPASLREVAMHLKSSLGIQHLRVIGDLEHQCRKLLLLPGAAGGQLQVALTESNHPDLLIVGEVREWETAEYFRDANQLGVPTAIIVLGHAQSEEAGMAWLKDWLSPKVPELPIHHIPSGDPYTWI